MTGKGLNQWSVQEKMGRVLRDLNVQTLLSVDVRPDLLDSSTNILQVSWKTNVSPHGYFKRSSSKFRFQFQRVGV